MATYKKTTKWDVNFPQAMSVHLNALNKRLKSKNWDRTTRLNLMIAYNIQGEEGRYCKEVLDLLTRLWSDSQWTLVFKRYKTSGDEQHKVYSYVWEISNIRENLSWMIS